MTPLADGELPRELTQSPYPTSTAVSRKSNIIIDPEEDGECPTGESTAIKLPLNSRNRQPLHILTAFIALSLSIFLVALDTVLIPTALPTISQSFHIPDSLYAWTGSAYLLANAASIPFWGKLSDIFGRKPVILIANLIFLGGSIVCAVSVSASMFVAGRAVQGVGGGGVIVLVHVCVSDLFNIRGRSFYMGTVGAVWALASALGPVLGGVFAQQLNWKWCFYINIPIISLSVVLLYFTLHLPSPHMPLIKGLASMDWLGTLTVISATIFLLVGLQCGSSRSYAKPSVIVCLLLGMLAYIAFPFSQRWQENRGRSPIMPLRIFKEISNLSALGVCACDALVFNSVAYFLPLYFQIVLGRSPTVTGVYMLAVAIPLATISFASGHLIEKTGRFLEVLQAGLFLMTLGIGLLISLDASLDLGKIIGILIVLGLGFGPNFAAPLIALQTHILESDIATGTSAFGFVRMVSGAIGLVVGQVVFQLLMAPQFQGFVDGGVPEEFARALAGGEAVSQTMAVSELPEDQKIVVRSAFMGALRGTWVFYTVIGALGLVVSFGIKRTKLRREAQCTELEMNGEMRNHGDSGAGLRH
ncbi:MFS general substrate transporter [Decorospora gaudefroyi]|uniref:MFS general substrate transporter n=1 Tax=Decorospora gaudefroyi TaxID=184978 RepID=A0A6A5KRC4_9PLEO|nr:MFS general substrate transporter [Decorospora gaudefroyi]